MAPPVNSVSRCTPNTAAHSRMTAIRQAEKVRNFFRRDTKSTGFFSVFSCPGFAAP